MTEHWYIQRGFCTTSLMLAIYRKVLKLQIFVCIFFLPLYHISMFWCMRHIVSTFLIGIVGFFVMSPSIALSAWQDELIVMSGRVGDSCTMNIECRDVGESRIVCRSSGEMIVPAGCTIRSVAGLLAPSIGWSQRIDWVIWETYIEWTVVGLLYEEPDTFVYPFVRITKIQV